MAKHWKSFLPSEKKSQSKDEILSKQIALDEEKGNVDLGSIIEGNTSLKQLMKEREELEKKMNEVTGRNAAEAKSDNKRYDTAIPSVTEKRKREAKWAQQREEKLKAFIQKKHQSAAPKKDSKTSSPIFNQKKEKDWFKNQLKEKATTTWEEQRNEKLEKALGVKRKLDRKIDPVKKIVQKAKQPIPKPKFENFKPIKKTIKGLKLDNLYKKIPSKKRDYLKTGALNISDRLNTDVIGKTEKLWDKVNEKKKDKLDLIKKTKANFKETLSTSTLGNVMNKKEIVETKKQFFSVHKKETKKKEEEKPKKEKSSFENKKKKESKDQLTTNDKKKSPLKSLFKKRKKKKEEPSTNKEKKKKDNSSLTTDDKKKKKSIWQKKKKKSESDEWQSKRGRQKNNNNRFSSLTT